MKRNLFTYGMLLSLGALSVQSLLAQDSGASATWHAKSLGDALWQTALFSLFGIGLAIVGYKLFDLFTPGQLHKEIIENKNVAAALIGAAIIVGVCILVAAAMIG